MACLELGRSPLRPATWLYGDGASSVQVWIVEGDERVRASVLIEAGAAPIVLMNRRVVGTALEHGALAWAFQRIADRTPGFYPWRV
jgi:hypothetical protein